MADIVKQSLVTKPKKSQIVNLSSLQLPNIPAILERAENLSRDAWRRNETGAGGTFATLALTRQQFEHDAFFAQALTLIVQATVESVQREEVTA